MPDDNTRGSVTRWFEELRQGNPAAAQRLWDRYYTELVRVARSKQRAGRWARILEGDEEAAEDALAELFQGTRRGLYPDIHDRNDLWKLLFTITSRKVKDQFNHATRKKRDARRNLGQNPDGEHDGPHGYLDCVSGQDPDASTSKILAEEYESLLNVLKSDQLKLIAIYRMDGYTNEQICERLGCSLGTFALRLRVIKATWIREFEKARQLAEARPD